MYINFENWQFCLIFLFYLNSLQYHNKIFLRLFDFYFLLTKTIEIGALLPDPKIFPPSFLDFSPEVFDFLNEEHIFYQIHF